MNSTASQPPSPLGPINIGNGLVEIGALTTLVGSNSAGDLSLGNQGAAGLVWGSITTFGNSSVIRACAGAAMPGWLRHVLGLSTRASNDAVGMDLSLNPSKFAQSIRSSNIHDPLAVLCESDKLDEAQSVRMPPHYVQPKRSSPEWRQVDANHTYHAGGSLPYKDVLAFNRTTSVMLEELEATSSGHPLAIYTFHSYDCFPFHNMQFQVVALALSLLKFTEIYYLFLLGGPVMGLLSAIPYTFSFIAASIVEVQDLFASRRPMSIDGHQDLVVGTPPTTKQIGGPRKVVLGALKSPKVSIWWKTYYGMNALLQISSLFIYYQLFGQEEIRLVVIWACFQAAWVAMRTLLFHLTASTEPMMYRRMQRQEIFDLSPSMRIRVLNIVAAVSTYQMHLHPRDIKHYKDDTVSAIQISKLLTMPNIHEAFDLPKEYSDSSMQLNIIAVIGDTLLSSATWMAGVRLSPMDLYDSCIVVISIPPPPGSRDPPRIVAIPSARVFSSAPYVITDQESRQPAFLPRGAGHNAITEERLDWIYWIPCSSGKWVHFWSEKQTVLGKTTVKVMSDKAVTALLGAGTLNISLKDAADVKAVVDVSREATNCLLSYIHVKHKF